MTLPTQQEDSPTIEGYRTQALHYFENAQELLGQEEWEKGAELLWGTLAEALKAYALSQDRWLRSHRELSRFAMSIDDGQIRDTFARAQALHADFYERNLDPEYVAGAAEYIREALRRLFALIESARQGRQG